MIREDVPLRPLQAAIFQDLIRRHRGHALRVNPTGAFLPGPGAPITPEAQAERQRSSGSSGASMLERAAFGRGRFGDGPGPRGTGDERNVGRGDFRGDPPTSSTTAGSVTHLPITPGPKSVNRQTVAYEGNPAHLPAPR